MRTRFIAVPSILVVLVGIALVLAAQLGAFQPEEPRLIPMNSIYSTFAQEGMKLVNGDVDSNDLAEAAQANREAPPRVVLAVGRDIAEAVKASTASFNMPEEPVAAIAGAEHDNLWVSAYLGTDGSIPPAFRINAVEVRGRTIRVAYERDESPGRSCDLRAYMIWAPTGTVEAGAYTVELYDVMAERVTATRPWNVVVR